ncbi:helix-turn-helix domain-containing protein [Candidatus Dependentiae bacterium]|nr:helix-turn-helix domain-containing protein [Candidatus Dependentiae bacterium]
MHEQVLLSVPINEFKLMIMDVVNECLHNTSNTQNISLTEIIDRRELCKRLAITEPTAIRWSKKGKIPFFRIGKSIRYNWQIVIDTLEKKGGIK